MPNIDLSKYDLVEKIGSGTYGTVYKAKHKTTGEFVAIKKLIGELATHICSDENEAILREAVIYSHVDSPRVLKLLGWYIKNFNMYLAFPFYKCDLQKHLQQQISRSAKIQIFEDIKEGIANIHKTGFAHRDLKPQNILIDDDGRAVIADLGSGKMIDAAKTPQNVCTLWYRAPEVFLERKEEGKIIYDETMDLWSIGCIAYEMCTRRPLFPYMTEVEMIVSFLKVFGFEKMYESFKIEANLPKFEPSPIRLDDEYFLGEIHKFLQLDPQKRFPLHDTQHSPIKTQILSEIGISPKVRAIVTEWMIEVCDDRDYIKSPQARRNAFSLFDVYISKYSIKQSQLQLLAMACMALSAEFFDTLSPPDDDWIYICDYAYSKQEFCDFKQDLLAKFDYKILLRVQSAHRINPPNQQTV